MDACLTKNPCCVGETADQQNSRSRAQFKDYYPCKILLDLRKISQESAANDCFRLFFDLNFEEFFISRIESEKMAEREGFEPSVRSPPRSLSKGVLSTTQPSLHDSVFGRAFDTQNSCSSSTISEDFFDYFFLFPSLGCLLA